MLPGVVTARLLLPNMPRQPLSSRKMVLQSSSPRWMPQRRPNWLKSMVYEGTQPSSSLRMAKNQAMKVSSSEVVPYFGYIFCV